MIPSEEKRNDAYVSLEFLDTILDKTIATVHHLDNQTNILVGLSSVVFVLCVSQIGEGYLPVLPLQIVALASASTSLIALFSLHPPLFLQRRSKTSSLLYVKQIHTFKNAAAYKRALDGVIESEEGIRTEYANEIYNISKYYYYPKRELFKAARNIFLFGIIFSLMLYIFGVL